MLHLIPLINYQWHMLRYNKETNSGYMYLLNLTSLIWNSLSLKLFMASYFSCSCEIIPSASLQPEKVFWRKIQHVHYKDICHSIMSMLTCFMSKVLKRNCSTKTSWFHMKECSKCWTTICISLKSVKPFLSYYQALKSGQGITKGIPLLRKSSEISALFHLEWCHIWQITVPKY